MWLELSLNKHEQCFNAGETARISGGSSLHRRPCAAGRTVKRLMLQSGIDGHQTWLEQPLNNYEQCLNAGEIDDNDF
jgi:hypothetical protein